MQKEKNENNENKAIDAKDNVGGSQFSQIDIKKKLKSKSKGDLVTIILNLSTMVDKHIAKNQEIQLAVINLNSDKANINDWQDYGDLLDVINKDVKTQKVGN